MKSLFIVTAAMLFFCSVNAQKLESFIENGKTGFRDKKTKTMVIPPIYDNTYPSFDEGYAAVRKNGKMGYIDTKGNVVIDIKYETKLFGSMCKGNIHN